MAINIAERMLCLTFATFFLFHVSEGRKMLRFTVTFPVANTTLKDKNCNEAEADADAVTCPTDDTRHDYTNSSSAISNQTPDWNEIGKASASAHNKSSSSRPRNTVSHRLSIWFNSPWFGSMVVNITITTVLDKTTSNDTCPLNDGRSWYVSEIVLWMKEPTTRPDKSQIVVLLSCLFMLAGLGHTFLLPHWRYHRNSPAVQIAIQVSPRIIDRDLEMFATPKLPADDELEEIGPIEQ